MYLHHTTKRKSSVDFFLLNPIFRVHERNCYILYGKWTPVVSAIQNIKMLCLSVDFCSRQVLELRGKLQRKEDEVKELWDMRI